MIREIKILKKMAHENIIVLHDAIDSSRQVQLPFVMPLIVVLGDGACDRP